MLFWWVGWTGAPSEVVGDAVAQQEQEDVVVAEQVKSKGAPSELVQGTEPWEKRQGLAAWLEEPMV